MTTQEKLLREAEFEFAIILFAICKQVAEDTGENSGSFPCPRCHVGTVRWSVAPSNSHGRVLCDHKWTDESGEEHYCTQVME